MWEEQNKRTYDNDEGRSISSESSGGCRPVDAPNDADCPRYRQEIWEKDEIDKTLRNLPNAELIINKITSIDIDGKYIWITYLINSLFNRFYY